MTILRPTRSLFRFSGAEAHKLLFDVVTGRLIEAEGPDVWFALLSPQGKIQAEGLSTYRDGAYWLDVDHSVADAFLKRMMMYRLRAQVVIDDLRTTHRVGWDAAGDSDPRGLGSRVIGTTTEAEAWQPANTEFDLARIERGVAELGPDFAPDEAWPHDIGMDLLHGVDFKKGCYIGQEVVSRMEHRGTARRRPVIVSGIEAKGPLVADGREVGSPGAIVDGKAIAIVRIDRIAEGAETTVGGRPVAVRLPDWATYRLGESPGAE